VVAAYNGWRNIGSRKKKDKSGKLSAGGQQKKGTGNSSKGRGERPAGKKERPALKRGGGGGGTFRQNTIGGEGKGE